jgi:small-conductance mechanosensitive channel
MVRHVLIGRIDKLLREQGIVIAFPQLDVHVKNAPAVPPR